jgi:hypothetical protein
LKWRRGRQGRGGGPRCGTAWKRNRVERGVQGSATWSGTAWTGRLQAAPTVVGGARLVGTAGAAAIGEATGVSDAGVAG